MVDALASERDALWTRLDKATFLTSNEKRLAAGYPEHAGGDDLAAKYNPYHDDAGRFTFGPDGARAPDGTPVVLAQAKTPTPKPQRADYGSTPKGLRHTEHSRERLMERGFTDERIDAIVDNNRGSRVGKIDASGQKTWEYSDVRGNTVVVNEHGAIVTVFSPAPDRNYIPKR